MPEAVKVLFSDLLNRRFFGNTFLKKVINKSIFKFVLKFMRDTGGPDLSFDTLKPKYNLILTNNFFQNTVPKLMIAFNHDDLDSLLLATI